MKLYNRIIPLITALLASYQVVRGIEGFSTLAVACFTIGFGVIAIAGLLMIILGLEILDSPLVVIGSTLVPLSLAFGLAAEYLPAVIIPYAIYAFIGFGAIVVTRFSRFKKPSLIILSLVHGIAGITISFLPVVLAVRGVVPAGFAFVGAGGMLIGLGGLMLSFLKAGKPIFSRDTVMVIFPGLLLLATAAFVTGFAFC